jgi:replicative DNA helicase
MSEPISHTDMSGDTPAPQLVRLGDLLGALQTDAEEAYRAMQEGRPRGPVTGLPRLDQVLGGAIVPGLHILHASPGVGKTALCLQIGGGCGCPCVLVTCEMAPLELLRRLIARVNLEKLDSIRAGAIPPDRLMECARKVIERCPNLAILDATQAFAGPELLRATVEKVRGSSPHALLIVDSLHSWTAALPADVEEYTALNMAIAELRSLARGLSCAVLAVAERNRMSMKNGGLSAGAGTRKLEYSAESVIEIQREEKEEPTPAGEVTVRIKVLKNRNGSRGEGIPVLWHDNYQRFREAQW